MGRTHLRERGDSGSSGASGSHPSLLHGRRERGRPGEIDLGESPVRFPPSFCVPAGQSDQKGSHENTESSVKKSRFLVQVASSVPLFGLFFYLERGLLEKMITVIKECVEVRDVLRRLRQMPFFGGDCRRNWQLCKKKREGGGRSGGGRRRRGEEGSIDGHACIAEKHGGHQFSVQPMCYLYYN